MDSKPRLKWTPQLHQLFLDAVSQLGGVDNAKVTHRWTSEDATTQDEATEAPPQCETTLKMQMEVQRHLQLRIEAQGKYLQSVLKKAQEALAGYSLSAIGIEAVRTELSELVSAMDTECLTSSISHGDSSAESCLTCGDVMETKEGNSLKQDDSSSALHRSQESDEFSQKTTKRMQNDDVCRAKRSCRREEDRSSFTMQEELDLNT
ncbi:Myb-like DNA-binding domain [Musa troglodytarum]|uniref:Myb-like DNA-binding domain n=1 Tax=Musa troglodytarum TaxID=320322 RepID=A0A9E7H9W9_9LILI|nr:Myb-like DNA-binding domain [Musa troglodytarum]